MKRNWMQILAVFLMGMLMPGIAMQFGQALVSARGDTQTAPATDPTQSTQTTQAPAQTGTKLPVLMDDGSLKIMELDAYLLGVVLAEMPASFETEALKAQAVAARTCAMQCHRDGVKHPGGAVCTQSVCCQAYMAAEDYLSQGGTRENVDKVMGAVSETSGQVLTYEGKLIQATYFSCSGGKTEDAVAVWGTEVPYLQSVISPGEEKAESFIAEARFSAAEFAALLGRNLKGSCASWLGSTTYTEGGGVATMAVAGKTYTGTELRKLLSLNSTAFTMAAEGDTIIVTTSGRGHRVGMSQYGADAMAVTGSTYEEILAYYYPGTRIDKLHSVE